MWLEVDANTRINHRRLADSVDAGAEVVATACPYCLLMFDDAIRSKGMGEQIKVMDIAEVLETQIGACSVLPTESLHNERRGANTCTTLPEEHRDVVCSLQIR